ncbi:MAG: GH36 C-terminal domain-containing protein, partial [Lachnospiraceae bacterium]|nr:GH36 C-terminal domain-containing protein [Lachnospiraceae bacterium]
YKVYQVNLDQEELMTDLGKVYSGAVLMNAGLIVMRPWGDFQSRIFYLEEV